MAKKAVNGHVEPISVETLVVGAGLSGVWAARRMQRRFPGMQILVLEADDRVGGHNLTGFHLVDAEACVRFELNCSPTVLQNAKVRWDRQWVDADKVDWESKEWALAKLPQWEGLLSGSKRLLLGLGDSDLEVPVKTRAPVRVLSKVEPGSIEGFEKAGWLVETPEQTFYCERIVWAAGLKAFQNAFGKKAAQSYLVANPKYKKEAAEARGGLSLELPFAEKPVFVEGLNEQSLLAVPVRHNSKLYLMWVVSTPALNLEGWTLKILVHLPSEILSDPKETLSFQKSIRRTLKNVLEEGVEFPADSNQARWVVDERASGHVLGTPWVFESGGADDGIEFVGEEALAAAESQMADELGGLDSVNALSLLRQNATNQSKKGEPELQVL